MCIITFLSVVLGGLFWWSLPPFAGSNRYPNRRILTIPDLIKLFNVNLINYLPYYNDLITLEIMSNFIVLNHQFNALNHLI